MRPGGIPRGFAERRASRRSLVEENRAFLVEANHIPADPLGDPRGEPSVLLFHTSPAIRHDVERHVDAERAPCDHVPRDAGGKAGAAQGDLSNLVRMKMRKDDDRGHVGVARPSLLDRVPGHTMVRMKAAIEVHDGVEQSVPIVQVTSSMQGDGRSVPVNYERNRFAPSEQGPGVAQVAGAALQPDDARNRALQLLARQTAEGVVPRGEPHVRLLVANDLHRHVRIPLRAKGGDPVRPVQYDQTLIRASERRRGYYGRVSKDAGVPQAALESVRAALILPLVRNEAIDRDESQIGKSEPGGIAMRHDHREDYHREVFMPLVISALILFVLACGSASAAPWEPAALSDSLGAELDESEREAYNLFPDLPGFERARFFTNGSSYRAELALRDKSGSRVKRAGVTPRAWELTRLHVGIVERYRTGQTGDRARDAAAASQYWLALKFASRARYDVSKTLLEDLTAQGSSDPVGEEAAGTLSEVRQLAGSNRGLFLPGATYDRSGRTDLLVFAGYYGIWTGIAVPVYFESEDAQAYAAGLLVAPTASLLIANALSKDTEMGVGRALMISLGGNLGTWQGIGWSAMADARGHDVVGIGLLSGLGSIGAAALLTHEVRFTEGHGALTNAALVWGAWLGLVSGIAFDLEGDDLLRASLVGTDALVFGTAIGARNAQMSKGRVRLISLMGVVGTVFGFGIDLLAEEDDEETAFAIAGIGTVTGLIVGGNITRNHDRGKVFSARPCEAQEPRVSFGPRVRADWKATSPRLVPAFEVRAAF